jgi:hypothetical protein
MEIGYVLRIRISRRRRRRDAAVSSQWTTCSILMVTVVILTSTLDETISLSFARVEHFELNFSVVGLSIPMYASNGTSIKTFVDSHPTRCPPWLPCSIFGIQFLNASRESLGIYSVDGKGYLV